MAVSNPVTTVVVGCDGSWQSQAAVEAATLEAGRRHCPLVLLSVARTDGLHGGLVAMRQGEHDAVVAATATAKRAAERALATDRAVPVQIVVARSVDDAQVADAARRAALLVVGGYGSRGQSAFSLSTTSGELVRRFGAPVLVPHRDSAAGAGSWDEPPEVLVGVNPSSGATQLLSAAAHQAKLRGWSLAVVHTVPTTHPGQRLHHEQQAVWDVVRAVPECALVPCHVEVIQGATIPTLLGRCGPRDLLVVSTRGGGTLAGLIEGSVARGVLDASVCDVLIVPAAADVGSDDAADTSARAAISP